MKITEQTIDAELLEEIRQRAEEMAEMLGIDPAVRTPAEITEAVDNFVHQWQSRGSYDGDQDEDTVVGLGSLWGEQLVRDLGWQWAAVIFHEHGSAEAVGVFSPDRSLAIYPLHFVYGCMENETPVTIFLAYNILKEGSRVPPLPAGGYENVMDNVHHIVPRD